jgi:glutathione peroxidase-family protein/CRP-like cAMP-binding protein
MGSAWTYRRGLAGRALGRTVTSLDMARFELGRAMTRRRRIRGLAAAFSHLPRVLLGEMADHLRLARFRRGEVIVREGDAADRFYIIESGQVEVTRSSSDGDVHVLSMGAGEYFGEVALLATRTRTATVRAVSEVRLLSLDRVQFQALVDASEPTAEDLAQVVSDRNVAAQPRADRIPLPAWTGRLQRLLKAPWAMHYNRLIVLVLAANALLAAYGVGRWEHFASALGTVALVAQANIALALIFRQQYVINFLGWLATRPPLTWPMRVRWMLGKYYHFGGLHVGFALSGTVWYLAFVAMLIYGFAAGKGDVDVAVVAVSSAVASLIVVIVFMAHPSSRTKRHDRFEATHRFLGWTVLVLVWVNTIVFATSRASGSAASAVLSAPTSQVQLLDGSTLDLASLRGRPTLIVNTASKCDYTPQYEGLQALYERYRDGGLQVLGFPSEDFAKQEYKQAGEIAAFCAENYGVSFALTEATSVRAHPSPLWSDLARQPGSGPPSWNFTKYLVGSDGKLIARWPTMVPPDDPELVEAIESALSG